MEGVSYEKVFVWNEAYESSVLFLCLPLTGIDKLAFAEFGERAHTVTESLDVEVSGQGVHSLEADSIQSYRLLVTLCVILTSCVEDTYSFYY